MLNYSAAHYNPQATIQPCILHTGNSAPSKALGSILGRVVSVSGTICLSDFDAATPLQPGLVAAPLSAHFLFTMDQIRLHLEAKVTQAGYHGPLDFTLQDFTDLFDSVVPRDASSRVVFGAITRWYRTVYSRQLYGEKCWRDLYEDTTPLTRQQEITFFQLMRSGTACKDRLRDLILHRTGGLVGMKAKCYIDRGLSLSELLSAGREGLNKAIDKFDLSRGYRFSTCAMPWIRGEITAAFKKATAETKVITHKTNAAEWAVEWKQIRCVEDYLELSVAVGQALARLNDPRKAEIITLRYGLFGTKEADTLKSIAEPLGITPQRVHAILNTSLARLKKDQELRLFYKRWFYR